ncbi:MAG: murein L,D-transpeptidase catalytic domain family protein [Bacteroidales bacterium]|nr:murein L,D-transpeptidase catalytic domain family protein [Bacteroidales bacterium]
MKRKAYIFIAIIIAILSFIVIYPRLTPGNLKTIARTVRLTDDIKYAILVDYGRHSGRNRLFVWDYEQDKVILSSPCAHGYGGGSTARHCVFSNEIGSKCSSEGKYSLMSERQMYTHPDRKCFPLKGLDKGKNDNAEKRAILIHPTKLPSFPIYPFLLPVRGFMLGSWTIRPASEGCVTLPKKQYEELSIIVAESDIKHFILYVYDSSDL